MIAKYEPGAGDPTLPTHKDLPSSDGAIVENFLEIPQRIILCESIRPWLNKLHPDGQFCVGSDSGIYWRLTDPPLKGCKAPDWFYVPGVPPALDGEPRGSYVMWQEKVIPPLLIELVSNDRDEERDATPNTGKFWVYEQGIQAPYYLIYDWRYGGSIDAYERIDGRYHPLPPNERGRYFIPPLQCEFGIRKAVYDGYDVPWLRAFDLDGVLLLNGPERADQEKEHAAEAARHAEQEKRRANRETRRANREARRAEEEKERAEQEKERAEHEKERAEHEKERAEHEKERAEHEKERADRLAARLRELGLDPDQP